MAKALFGHVGSAPDRRMLDEVTQLRAKVRALEFEVARLRAENDRLSAAAAEVDLLRLPEPLGPTTQVIPGSSLSVVAEAKDLNPLTVRLLRCT